MTNQDLQNYNFIRSNDGFLLNINEKEYQNILSLRESNKKELELKNKINSLEEELIEIRNLIKGIING